MKATGLVVGLALVVFAGCARPPAPPRTWTVTIDKMAYGAAPAGVHVGDTVVWKNADIFEHTATARDGQFDLDLKPGESGATILKVAGAVAVFCRYHPDMKLNFTVEPRT